MWRQQKTLASLHQELETIAVFDRVHDLATAPDPAGDGAYASRQLRRPQIMAEITKLNNYRPGYRIPGMIGSIILLLCAVGYATLHYSLK